MGSLYLKCFASTWERSMNSQLQLQPVICPQTDRVRKLRVHAGPQEIFSCILDSIVKRFGCKAVMLWLVDENRHMLERKHLCGIEKTSFAKTAVDLFEIDIDERVLGGKAITIANGKAETS